MVLLPNFRPFAKCLLAGTACILALSACMSNSRAGMGELYLSEQTQQSLKSYMSRSSPTVFAVSTDGKS